jgi:ribosomal protein L12E/L44/L45/RPP1/RPP2
MVVGFNHNFRYKGEVYHVQTEDGGLKSPNIITLLYKGGTILASKKTSYADITKSDHLEKVVEELMREQHREMLRRLKTGDLDAVLQNAVEQVAGAATTSAPAEAIALQPSAAALPPPTAPPVRSRPEPESSLDEIILSYLVGEDEEQR